MDSKELNSMVEYWLNTQVEVFNDEGIQKLVSHCDKCLNSSGDYVGIM
jgi:hypothetical protein